MWQVLKELILAIFYPHYCPACHEEVEGAGLLCEACRRDTYAPGYLELEKETVPHLDAVYRLYRYEGGIKRALHGLKYEKRRDYLDRMGEEVLHHEADLEPLFTGNPFVVALPTDPKRRKTRGYEIPPAIFGPYLKKHAMILTQALWRQKATKPQYGLSRAERRENIAGSFAFHPVKLDGTVIVIDPAMGSGSLLLNVRHYIQDVDSIEYYGQEIKTSTYNLARMNMIIHGIAATNQHLRNADTLDRDWPSDEVTTFDGVMMNPPYSQHWSADKGFLNDPRFSDYGVLAPKSKADYAFLLHGLYHLRDSGTMGIVLPHGVLFRGAAEGKIRQKLLEKGYIHAVIGLPAGIFYSTGIPTIIMVLKKARPGRDVLFIDGSQEFEKGKAKNTLTQANIQKLFQGYTDRKDVDKFAHVASFEEIQENDFNLNIPRYVDTSEPEPEIDLGEVNREMAATNHQIQAAEKELADMMEELTTDDPKKAKDLQDLLHLFQ